MIMAAEKMMDRKKAVRAAEIARRGPRLPWPPLISQLGGNFKASSRTGTEFRVTFPKKHPK
jgi:hypothetical protein